MKISITLLTLILSLSLNAQWQNIPNFTTEGNSLFATNPMTCHVAGDNGLMHRTTDGGENWTTFDTGFEYSWIYDVQFLNESVGYACGGTYFGWYRNVIIKTTDGGLTWDSLNANGFDANNVFGDLHFVNETTGFLLGENSNYIVKTTDGGQSFSEIAFPENELSGTAIHFIDEQTGFLASRLNLSADERNYKIYKTEDQGTTWTIVHEITTPNLLEEHRHIFSIFFRDETQGYAVGDNGWFYRSTDGGDSWESSKFAADYTTGHDVVFTDADHGYLAASYFSAPPAGFTAGSAYETVDGGQTWTQVLGNSEHSFTSVSMIETGIGYLMNYDSVYKRESDITDAVSNISKNQINLFPNPSSDKIRLSFSTPQVGLEVSLIDPLGRILKIYELDGDELELSISNLTTGQYWLSWTEGGKLMERSFLRE